MSTPSLNVSIDDNDTSVHYYPSGAWNPRSASLPCSTCTANPNADLMFEDTFHDGTFNPDPGSNNFPNVPLTASVLFNGTAVYVFCALAESSTSPDGDSDMSFYIDGVLAGTFVKKAPGVNNVYDYAVPVFAIESLTPEQHNMTLQNGHVNGTKALVLLDEIVYTAINTTSTSSSSTPTSSASSSTPSNSQGSTSSSDSVSSTKKSMRSIIGPAVAVPIIILLLAAVAWFFLKRRKRQSYTARRATIDALPPPENGMTGAWTSEPLSLPASHPVYGAASGASVAAPFGASSWPQNAEAGPSGLHSPSSYTPSSYANTSAGPSSSDRPANLVDGAISSTYGNSRHRAPPSTGVSSVSAGMSGIQPSDTGSGATSYPITESSASSRPVVDAVDDEVPDEAPPAYDELRARGASLHVRDRKTRIQSDQRPLVVNQ